MGLDLSEFRKINVKRCEDGFFKLDAWDLTAWGNALGEETGEVQGVIKRWKLKQTISGVPCDIPKEELADEMADVIGYLDLLAARAGIDLSEAIVKKFNMVSDKVKSSYKIEPDNFKELIGKTIPLVKYGDFLRSKSIAEETRKTIEMSIRNKESVSVDFAGISGITSNFAHEMVSKLLINVGMETLKKHVKFINVTTPVYNMLMLALAHKIKTDDVIG